MTARHRRIALIHATPVAIDPVVEAFGRLWPEAELANLLEDSLAPDLAGAGELEPAMIDRFRRLARYAADCGAEGILFTCSAFGPAIEIAAADLAPLPVLKPNEAMFAEALTRGDRIGMVATFAPSVPSMESEFHTMASAARPSARLETVCAEGAMNALRAGDTDEHNALVAEAAASLVDCDVLMLAHFSTARAQSLVEARVAVPVLSSPDSAVTRLMRG